MRSLISGRKKILIETFYPLKFLTLLMIFFLLPALFFSPSLFSLEASLSMEKYLARIWTTENGLPQNTITSLVQTSSGYIWIGTPTGLVRYDGVQFKVFSRTSTPALTDDRITSLHEDSRGILWIGTDGGGLYSLTPSPSDLNYKWKLYTTQEGLSNNSIRTIISDWQGNLWVGTDYGLNRIGLEGIRIYTTADGLYDNIITALELDIQGNLWVGTLQGGLTRIQDYAIYTYGPKNGLLNPSVLSLESDPLGNIWAGTMEGLYFSGRDHQVLQYIPRTAYTPITSLIRGSRSDIWIGTMADGLMRMRYSILFGLSLEKRLPSEYVHCLMFDNKENLWIGTDTEGLIELKTPQISNITKNEGLPENTILALIEDRTGLLWAGTKNSGLCSIKDNHVDKIFNRSHGLTSNSITSLFEDDQGSLWIATRGGGINILKDDRIVSLTAENGLKSNTINTIIQDTTGMIWIGTESGLNRISGGKVQEIETKDIPDLEGHSVKALIQGGNNVIYIATSSDLFAYQDGIFTQIEVGSETIGFEITSFYEDSAGILWIGTKGSGLKCLSDRTITSLTTKNGLVDDYIYGINEDNQGSLWMSTNRGIMKLKRDDLLRFFQGKIDFIHSIFFDENDGMVSRQGSSEGQPSLIASSSGLLFCANSKGIIVINPENLSIKEEPPEVILEEVKADNQSVYGEDGKITLSHRPAVLSFHFTAIDFIGPEKIRFEYHLEGHDAQISHVGPEEDRAATYINLPSGHYRFTVRAINNDGVLSDNSSAIEIEIRSPFYRTNPFYIGMILFVLLLTGGGIALRHKKKARKLADKYKTSGIDPGRIDEIIPKLLHLMEEDKLYLDPGLTLKELAHKLRIHYNHLSRIINERFGLSYNDFVNKYRVAEAQKILADPKYKEMNILDIIYETGFYSKSVFNTAFKKFTGKTPSEYRRSQLD